MKLNRAKQTLALAILSLAAATALGEPAATPANVDFLQPAKRVVIRRGDQELPMPSAREALAAAKPGDTIVLGAGTHVGPLTIKTNDIHLTGETGARINGNDADWKPVWTAAPEFGANAYTTPIPWQPVTMAIDQRVMIDAVESRGGLAVHRIGAGRNGRDALGAVFTYQPKQKRVVVSFATDLKPAEHQIEATRNGESALTLSADNCVVENLAITGGSAAVLLTNAKNSTVQNCLLYAADAGARLGPGAAECHLLKNDITWNQDAVNLDADPATADVGNDVWHTHKKFGTYDKFGVSVDRTGDNNEIAGNYIYNVWNGITTDDGIGKSEIEKHFKEKIFKGIATFNRGLKVHHNRLDLTLDDALEPGGEVSGNQWYSNTVSRARCAARIKTVSIGPLFFYDNTLTECGDGLRLYKSVPEQANVYIFHNAIQFTSGVIYHEMNSVAWDNAWLKSAIKPGTPNFWIFNNLFICKNAFAANSTEGDDTKPNFKGDNNLFTSGPDSRTRDQGIDVHSIFEATPKLVNPEAGDYHLQPGSPGSGAGADLSKLPLKVELPSRLRQAATGHNPDIGLLPPDGESAPHGPVTPLWAAAAKQMNLGERDLAGMQIVPSRWVAGPKVKYVASDLPENADLTLQLNRSIPTHKSAYTVTITDSNGKPVLTKKATAEDVDGMTLKLRPPTKTLTITIEDDRDASLELSADAGKLGIDAATETSFRKFDGTPMVMHLTPTGDKPITLEGKSKYGGMSITVVDPDGGSTSGTSVKIDPKVAGSYKVLFNFTKAGSMRVDGGGVLELEAKGQPIALRPQWGKPKF